MTSLQLREDMNGVFEAWAWEEVTKLRQDGQATTDMPVDGIKLTGFTTWKAILEALQSLGFEPNAERSKPWVILGLSSDARTIDSDTDSLIRSRCCTLRAFTHRDSTKMLPELEKHQLVFWTRYLLPHASATCTTCNFDILVH